MADYRKKKNEKGESVRWKRRVRKDIPGRRDRWAQL